MRRSILLLLTIIFVLCSIPCLSGEEIEKPLDITKLSISKSLVMYRYPEVMGFTVPQNAAKMMFIGAKPVLAIQLFELPRGMKSEYSVRRPMRTEYGSSVNVDGLKDKTLYVLIAFDMEPGANMPLISPVFYGAQLDELEPSRVSHTTGWVEVKTDELLFVSHSPIASFLPRLLRTDVQGNIVHDFAETADLNRGTTFSFLSPFRVTLTVPANHPNYRVCAEMELLGGFPSGGQIFIRHLIKGSPEEFLPARTSIKLAPHERRVLPDGTTSVHIVVKSDDCPNRANIGLHGGESLDCAGLIALPFAKIEGEKDMFEATADIGETLSEEGAIEILAGGSAKYSLMFSYYAFNAPVDFDATELVKVFECLDQDGKVIEDLAKNPPFMKVE